MIIVIESKRAGPVGERNQACTSEGKRKFQSRAGSIGDGGASRVWNANAKRASFKKTTNNLQEEHRKRSNSERPDHREQASGNWRHK